MTRWDPAPPAEAAAAFDGHGCRWWVAGGIAIERAVGRRFRDHADLDVLLLRRDQLVVQRALPDWEWWAADPPGRLRPWRPGEVLPAAVHDIWCRPGPRAPWRLQVMLDESRGEEWTSRRDPGVRRPLDALTGAPPSADGIPFLTPEVQLYYKAQAPRPKDETDFRAVLPVLTAPQRRWLAAALTRTYGLPHPWAARLTE
ncbi:nucleotidyltransferase domain-containing protein [Streptomyces catenulae]|uniref:nucleotidyltransferase domain-containing protein n=1 Tax=Streptomyces catenulae TaxID=66875 RepID=UPI0004C19CBB